MPGIGPGATVIFDLMGSTWESMQILLAFWLLCCSDSRFLGVNLGITVGKTSRIAPGLQRFLISWGQLGNRCKVFPVYTLFRASILDFRPRLGNRCKVFPVYTLFRASIPDFKAKLANRCSAIVVAVENGPPAPAVAASTCRVRS